MNDSQKTIIIGDVIITPEALEAIRLIQTLGTIDLYDKSLDNTCSRLLELA